MPHLWNMETFKKEDKDLFKVACDLRKKMKEQLPFLNKYNVETEKAKSEFRKKLGIFLDKLVTMSQRVEIEEDDYEWILDTIYSWETFLVTMFSDYREWDVPFRYFFTSGTTQQVQNPKSSVSKAPPTKNRLHEPSLSNLFFGINIPITPSKAFGDSLQ